jgi:hypothetical protein
MKLALVVMKAYPDALRYKTIASAGLHAAQVAAELASKAHSDW